MISAGATTLLPSASAHTPPYEISTYAAVSAQPPIIGVGQSALVYAYLRMNPLSGSTMFNTFRNHNYTITITDPNGKAEVYHWDTVEDTTGVQFFRFTPTVVGQYNISFLFGGNVLNSTWFDTTTASAVGDKWLPSTANCTLIVQEDPVKEFPASYALPVEYWTRPIYGENNYWFTISSDWLGIGSVCLSDVSYGTISTVPMSQSGIQRYPGDAVGSLTSHVMWTKPLQEGGVVGGDRFETAGDTYFEGSAYNNRYTNPIIMYGRLFYREPVSFTGVSSGDSVCVDLRTGEEIWRRSDLPAIACGYTFDVQSPNQHGVYPAWLCTSASNFGNVYDMWTGKNLFNVSGSPSGFSVLGPQGELLKYNVFSNGTTGYFLSLWNSSKLFRGAGYTGTGNTITIDTSTGGSRTTYALVNTTTYVNNVKTVTSENVSTTVLGSTTVNATMSIRYEYLDANTQNVSLSWCRAAPTVLAVKYADYMLCRNGSYSSNSGVTQNTSGTVYVTSANWTYYKINLNSSKGAIGSILWTSPTITHKNDESYTFGGFDPVAEVVTEVSRETQNIKGYSTKDSDKGKLLWETNKVNTLNQQDITPLDYFGNPYFPYYSTQTAYGNIYGLAYGGVMYCYNLTTGVRTWTYGNGNTAGNTTDTGTSVPGYFPSYIQAVGNGVIYAVATQHTIITPISKGQMSYAVNATSGELIWEISDYTGSFNTFSYAMADGYCNWLNGYDNNIYTVGRGPTTLSVSAPNLAAASDQPIVITGSVLDISAGSKQDEQAARFPNGIPCASDAAMSDWMGYVYQQKPLPSTFEGVTVDISVVDANGNYRSIGEALTDAKGNYNLVWAPDIPGTYQVIATFAGTNGYWPSSSTTAFSVMEAAPAVTASPTPAPSISDQYFVPAIAGLFAFVAIIGVVIILVLRKRP
ncbi:MAG: hypothetical protein NWE93_00515 [Candidatus Bathyarchaeota archaeon]|nr:hypothetical protein [Candidatus Bathyarchaeota archaeon]